MKTLIKRLIKLILMRKTNTTDRKQLKRLAANMIDLGITEYENGIIKVKIHPDMVRLGNKIEYVLETAEQRRMRKEQELIDKVKQQKQEDENYLKKIVGEFE